MERKREGRGRGRGRGCNLVLRIHKSLVKEIIEKEAVVPSANSIFTT
jgi:hypothetical protein